MRFHCLLFIVLTSLSANAQPRVLHFTRTSGFDHNTRAVSFAMFQSIGLDLGVIVDDDASAAPFSDPVQLALYDVIVFSNTSGDAILDPVQRSNFEQWVTDGGHVLGIHAATDTYRHSTANGTNTGSWDFYAELIGGSVQQNPNHVTGTPAYAMDHIGQHASTAGLPDPWSKNEEYYYWESGYYNADNVDVLRVEETIGPNAQVNSYDAPRPMSWYRNLPGGNKVFYTALGHAQSNYTADTLFRTHIADALAWLLDPATTVINRPESSALMIYPDPADTEIHVNLNASSTGRSVEIYDLRGTLVLADRVRGERTTLDIAHLAPGPYVVRVSDRTAMLRIVR